MTRRRGLMALAAAALVAAAIYTALPRWLVEQVTVRRRSLVIRGVGGSGLADLLRGRVRARLELTVHNAAWIDITLRQVRWRVLMEGEGVASGDLESGVVLLSDREQSLSFDAQLEVASLGRAALEALRSGSPRLEAEVDVEAETLGLGATRRLSLDDLRISLDEREDR
jgi:hypothetical protein